MITFVFPGQGSQYVGMGKDFYNEFPVAKQTYEEASDSIGDDLAKLCFEGEKSELSLTANAQPAILTTSIAILRVLNDETELSPDFVAGHSLGEYTALVSTGCMKLSDAVYVVRKRGEFMQDSVPVGVGSMAAILGLEENVVNEICRESSDSNGIASPANFNSPGQIVISGNIENVEKASLLAREKGAKRVIPLDVSAPFHCSLMENAASRLKEVLDTIEIGEINCPVVTNVEATANTDSSRVKELLVRQVTSPVRWTETLTFLNNERVENFIEIGPSSVLSGLIKRTIKGLNTVNIEKTEQLNHIKGLQNGT